MRVIPERASLLRGRELVEERVIRNDGTLRDARGAISPRTALLEEAVPVLRSNELAIIMEHDAKLHLQCWSRAP